MNSAFGAGTRYLLRALAIYGPIPAYTNVAGTFCIDQGIPAAGIFLRPVFGLPLPGEITMISTGIQHSAPFQEELHVVQQSDGAAFEMAIRNDHPSASGFKTGSDCFVDGQCAQFTRIPGCAEIEYVKIFSFCME
jgi:hypothetical protein